jgi:uncharacterized protein with HEPN domain
VRSCGPRPWLVARGPRFQPILNLALVRLLEIVGEAAARVPDDVRTRHSVIPWPQIVGLRNRLIHGYDTVDFDILWQIVIVDLPPLIGELDRILGPSP